MTGDTVQLDPQQVRDAEVARLKDQFGVHAWYGHHTRLWWAMVPHVSHLVGGVPSLPALEGQIIRRLGLLP